MAINNSSSHSPALPVASGAVSANAAAQSPSLADQKTHLEIQKLEYERSWRFFLREKLPAFLSPLVGLLTLLALYSTGLLDAARQHLAAQGERLTLEKLHLEQHKEKLIAEVNAKTKELEEVKKKLLPFEREEVAINELKNLQNKNLLVKFRSSGQLEGLKVTFQGIDEQLDWSMISKPRRNPNLAAALKKANNLRALKALRTVELSMTPEELALASQHDALETLVINYADLDSESLGHLVPRQGLTSLSVKANSITSLEKLPMLDALTFLDASSNPINDEGMKALAVKFPKLEHLDLSFTDVSDEGVQYLAKLPNLTFLCLENTRVIGTGLVKLLDSPKPLSVRVRKAQMTDQLKALLNQPNARLHVVTDPRDDLPPNIRARLDLESATLAVVGSSRDDW